MLINSKNTCKALEKKNWSGQIFFFFLQKSLCSGQSFAVKLLNPTTCVTSKIEQ